MKEIALETVGDLLRIGRNNDVVLAAPGRQPLTYDQLRQQAKEIAVALNTLGMSGSDRVAIVLQNGPEMASTFLCTTSVVTTAPLNPSYRASEFSFYLSDLKAQALIVEHASSSPAVAVAKELGLHIIEIVWNDDEPAGTFKIVGIKRANNKKLNRPAPSNIAIVLHTSGTTSRPKIVPLSQRNLAISAQSIAKGLALSRTDCCLNIMPLFHIHGLMAALLASVASGGSVFCSPGFNALRFYSWLDEAKPSWYTAVPTMHQAILSRAERNRDNIKRTQVRFLRSSSASLPPQVMKSLENTFNAPVIEAYGMTEAAHQMASNPLPPRPRKAGKVGLPASTEVEVMDPSNQLLGPDMIGEIVIRGENVFKSYENNQVATDEAFSKGWFRTGDQGKKDGDGYISITGRLKELINRGGEKISPLEIDEIILDHPAVEQVVTFAAPHKSLGEEVAAAIVLQPNSEIDKKDIQDFVSNRAAPFKVPRQILILKEIPKGPTGKLLRIGLAEKLGLK